MRYDKPKEPGWYWAASTRNPDFMFPVYVSPPRAEHGMLGELMYATSWTDGGEQDRPVSKAPDHMMWGPRIEAPRFSINPQWEAP